MSTDIHSLAGAYALDAIDEAERAAFSRHIAGCESCAREVASLREVAARLGSAAAEQPPERLRTKVLAATIGPGNAGEVASTSPPGTDRRWRRWVAVGAAASLVAISASVVTWVVAERQVHDAQARAAELQAERSRMDAVLTASDVRVHSTMVTGGGRLTVLTSPGEQRGVAVLSDLSAPPAGEVYQMWLMHGDDVASAVSVGVMPAGRHNGVAMFDHLDGADTFGVTLEPVGGSARPTGPPVVGVPVV